jgi:hypothetical protein
VKFKEIPTSQFTTLSTTEGAVVRNEKDNKQHHELNAEKRDGHGDQKRSE